MSFGVADYAASMGMQTTNIGERKRIIIQILKKVKAFDGSLASSYSYDCGLWANGILPGWAVWRISDRDYIAQAKRSATLGMAGKWAIHPSQVELQIKFYSI